MKRPISSVRCTACLCKLLLGALLSSTALGANVSVLGIGKTAGYFQTSASSVVPVASGPFSFRAFVELAPGGKLLLAIITPPSGNPAPLLLPPGGNIFNREEKFETERDLNAAYPPGTYRILTHTFTHAAAIASMNLPADTFAGPPRIQNYDAAQIIDNNLDFMIAWQPFQGATKADLVQLQVTDLRGRQVFATPGIGATNALSSNTTSTLIPAGTLRANQTYFGKLLFGKFTSVDRAGYPDAVVLVGFFSETRFTLGTMAPPPSPLRLAVAPPTDGLFRLEFPSLPGKRYQIEVSSDLATWSSMLSTNATGSSISFLDVETLPLRFYRVRTNSAGL
ncbi:MAG: hypothetical protein L0Z50_27960 [Verrucomicrobiales bacterium]|nr:hypothetical protein [Verrucomicrobiales bacterium]